MLWLYRPATRPLPCASRYVALGWAALPFLQRFNAVLPNADVALIVGGGVVYSLGALVYAAKRPDPVPQVYGYHEASRAVLWMDCHETSRLADSTPALSGLQHNHFASWSTRQPAGTCWATQCTVQKPWLLCMLTALPLPPLAPSPPCRFSTRW